MIDNFIPIFDWVKDIVVMIVFINPKWQGPEWLRKLLMWYLVILLLAIPVIVVVLALTC